MKRSDHSRKSGQKIRRTIFFILFYCLALCEYSAQADSSGSIRVILTDSTTREIIPFANVILYKRSGQQVAVGTTNMDGETRFKSLVPGKYDALGVYVGYQPRKIRDIVVRAGKTSYITLALRTGKGVNLSEVEIVGYAIPLIDPDTKSSYTVTREEYSSLATKDVSSVAGTMAGSYEADAPPLPYRENVKADHPAGPKDIRPGLLTASEIDDFRKWDLWSEYSQPALASYSKTWKLFPGERYVLQLKNKQKRPLCDAVVKMYDRSAQLLWQARTDNTGKAELWRNFTGDDGTKPAYLTVTYDDRIHTVRKPLNFRDGLNILTIDAPCKAPEKLEVLFVVDATGSMGDEINYLKRELEDIIDKIKEQTSAGVMTGALFYRDLGDEYVTRRSDLSADHKATVGFIQAQRADGGGDYEEAVDKALDEAVNRFSWSGDRAVRLMFLLLDAPPHADAEKVASVTRSMKMAAAKGIRIIPVISSGSDASTEYLNRCLALATNGTYVFLTDHSGIGGKHEIPTTPSYDVEYLNGLMLRIVKQFSAFSCSEEDFIGLQADTGFVIIDRVIVDSAFISSQSGILTSLNTGDSATNACQEQPKIEIRFYPNPCSGDLTIECPEGVKELFLCDMQARILRRIVVNAREIKLDLKDYCAGTYLLKYEIMGRSFTGKILLRSW